MTEPSYPTPPIHRASLEQRLRNICGSLGDTYDVPSEDPYRYPGGTSVTSLLLRNWLLLPI